VEKSDIHHIALNVRQEISHDDFDNHAYFPNLIFLSLRTLREKESVREKATTTQKGSSPHSPSRATMSTQSDMSVADTTRPAFDPGLDVATVVFSHVQCVRTRHSLARVSKLWRDASKPAAAYPLRFDWGAFSDVPSWARSTLITKPSWEGYDSITDLLDNDEALSLPYERVVGLLGELHEKLYVSVSWGINHVIYQDPGTVRDMCLYAASRGSVRLLKWARENNHVWSAFTCSCAAANGHLPVLQYLHENGCPWNGYTCVYARDKEHWDCLQYEVDNKAPGWKWYAKKYARHLR